MNLIEALEKANTDRFYAISEQVLSHAELPVATRNRTFSNHADLVEATDRRISLYKHVKFTKRSFDGDAAQDTTIHVRSSSKEPPHQIKTSTKQIDLNIRNNVHNFGNLRKKCDRNYAPKHIDINLAEVNRG